MTPTTERARELGFTLVEVMIALFFLSFMVTEMAALSVHATRSSTYAQRLTRANMIAEAVVEACRNTDFDKLKTRWFIDADADGAWDAGEPVETMCFDTNGNGRCDTGEAAPAANQATTFSWGYDIMNGAQIPSYFTRSRTIQYSAVSGLAIDSFTADVNVIVSWTDTRGQTQQVRLASVVSKY